MSAEHAKVLFLFFPEIGMKCQNLFTGENKKNITNVSAELAKRVVRLVHFQKQLCQNYFCPLLKKGP